MEKHLEAGAPSTNHPQRSPRNWKLSVVLLRSLFITSICIIIYRVAAHTELPRLDVDWLRRDGVEADKESVRVPLEAHVMSKCPDARYCLQELIVPTMAEVHHKVDFKLSFIGTVINDTSGVECLHGPTECVGNMLLLCAANLPYRTKDEPVDSKPSRQTPVVRSLGFANCLISDYERIPERSLVENCALEFGIDFQKLNECVSQQSDENDPDYLSGLAFLRESFQHSTDVGVTKSCTVRLDEKFWCVRDGKEWKECGDDNERSEVSSLTGEIKRLWKEKNRK